MIRKKYRSLSRALSRALSRDSRALSRALSCALSHALSRARSLARSLTRSLARSFARSFARPFSRALYGAMAVHHDCSASPTAHLRSASSKHLLHHDCIAIICSHASPTARPHRCGSTASSKHLALESVKHLTLEIVCLFVCDAVHRQLLRAVPWHINVRGKPHSAEAQQELNVSVFPFLVLVLLCFTTQQMWVFPPCFLGAQQALIVICFTLF